MKLEDVLAIERQHREQILKSKLGHVRAGNRERTVNFLVHFATTLIEINTRALLGLSPQAWRK